MESTAGKEYRRQSVDTAVDTLGYAVIGQLFIRVGTAVSPRIFTDTVENDDRFVHGIADDGQDSGQEGRIDFQMEEGEKAQYHDQVMENGNQRGNSDFVFEPQGNIRRQGDKGDGQAHNRILRDFRADDSPDGFGPLHFCPAQFAAELVGNRLAFIRRQVAHADHDILGRILVADAGKLDDAVFQIHIGLVHDVTHLGDGDGLFELHVQNRAACIINAKVEPIDENGNDTENDQYRRQGEPPFFMSYNVESHLCPPLFFICSGTLRFSP